MKKMLTLVAIAALVLSISVPALAATENLSFGGQAEFRGIIGFKDNGSDSYFAQSEIYLWATADLADNVMAKVNIKYRNNFGGPQGIADANTGTAGDLVLQEGYLKLGKMWDSPVSAVVGRWVNEKANESGLTMAQNRNSAVPFYGEGFIIPNNNPVDGVKATYDGETWWVDVLWYKNTEGGVAASDDDSLYGLYGQYKGIENHTIDGYLLYDDNQISGTNNSNQVTMIGARAEGKITAAEGLAYKAELAYSYANIAGPGDSPDGFGGYGGVDYTFQNNQYCPSVRLNGYYLEHNFTQPWGHVDQDDLGESAYGRIIDAASGLTGVTNGAGGAARGFYFFNLGGTIKPADKWSVDGDYYHYNNAWGNSVLGSEIDLRASFQYSENVAAEVIFGYFMSPGNPTGLASATSLGLGDDAYAFRGGLKVSF